MSSLTDKLLKFEDFELAFVLRYRGSQYTKQTRDGILEEIKKRGLSDVDLDDLINEKLSIKGDINNHNICPRCSSEKIITNRQLFIARGEADGFTEGINEMMGEAPKYQSTFECAVCGWDFQTEKNATEKKVLSKILWLILFLIVSMSISLLFFE